MQGLALGAAALLLMWMLYYHQSFAYHCPGCGHSDGKHDEGCHFAPRP